MAGLSHVVTSITGYFTAKQKMAERKMEMEHEVAMFPKKFEAAKEEFAMRGFLASYEVAKSESKDNAYPWATTVLTLTRPVLTVLMLIMSFSAEAWHWVNAEAIHMASGTVVGWWFGSRQITKMSNK